MRDGSSPKPPRTPLSSAAGLAVFLGLCLGAGAVGSAFTTPRIDTWYAALDKPAWTPPDQVFGPVWTVLYIAMAVAAWLVWRRCGFAGARRPLGLFALQLALNIGWSAIFFGLRRPDLAAVEIVLLWLAILATLIAFYRVSRPAGWLFVPYLAWVSYAAALNFAIVAINP